MDQTSESANAIRDEKGRFLPRTEQEIAEDAVNAAENNPHFVKMLLDKLKKSPVLNHMAKQNSDAALLATKAKVGGIILGRIRENIFRPMLPEEYKGVMDSGLVCGAVDFGVGNLLMFLAEMTQDRLPEKMRPYAGYLGEAALISAYHNTLSKIDVEGLIQKILSGDVMDMLDGAFNAKK